MGVFVYRVSECVYVCLCMCGLSVWCVCMCGLSVCLSIPNTRKNSLNLQTMKIGPSYYLECPLGVLKRCGRYKMQIVLFPMNTVCVRLWVCLFTACLSVVKCVV